MAKLTVLIQTILSDSIQASSIHPFSAAHLWAGCGGNSSSRETQTSLFPVTLLLLLPRVSSMWNVSGKPQREVLRRKLISCPNYLSYLLLIQRSNDYFRLSLDNGVPQPSHSMAETCFSHLH